MLGREKDLKTCFLWSTALQTSATPEFVHSAYVGGDYLVSILMEWSLAHGWFPCISIPVRPSWHLLPLLLLSRTLPVCRGVGRLCLRKLGNLQICKGSHVSIHCFQLLFIHGLNVPGSVFNSISFFHFSTLQFPGQWPVRIFLHHNKEERINSHEKWIWILIQMQEAPDKGSLWACPGQKGPDASVFEVCLWAGHRTAWCQEVRPPLGPVFKMFKWLKTSICKRWPKY